ncbi:hypothetical protein MN116_003231 [Schistosoma mekongi]|uniref:Uncharacterized protein n=1 Tax=Schistosoma mekongi TaxID=38744 RepID=A0AAE2D8E5_SCHME|nr:hypothetical protein MN116_003231 [Schistosoma mekongi]
MISPFNTFNLITIICSLYLLITKIYCLNHTNLCDFLKPLESKCLIEALEKSETEAYIQAFKIAEITPVQISRMTGLCKDNYDCTLHFTECILPAFKVSECEIHPLLIRVCQNFNIQVKGDYDTEKLVCIL